MSAPYQEHRDGTWLTQYVSGFNSFTQQICVNDAVTSTKTISVEAKKPGEVPPPKPIAQDVTYKTSIVDKVTDITNEMNVSFLVSSHRDF